MPKGSSILQKLRQAGRGDRLLRHIGMGDSVTLPVSAEPVRQALQTILQHWPIEKTRAPARIAVSGREGNYRLTSPWLASPQVAETPTSAACALIIEMARSWLHAHPGTLCLHCAAFERDGKLIVLAGTNRSGKSTLAAALGAAGAKVYCDDMLPLTPDGQGVAFGIPPRLRLPLPPSLHGTLASEAALTLVSNDARYGYTKPPNLAPHGEAAPLGGVVLLDRVEDGASQFFAVDRSEALAQLLLRNLHRDIGAGDTLDRLLDVAQSVPVIRLRYAQIDKAVQTLLGLDMGNWPIGESAVGAAWSMDTPKAQVDPHAAWRHISGVGTRTVDGDLYAVHPTTEEIFRLNPVAAVLWELFAEPTSLDDAAGMLAEALPHANPETLRADVAALMAALMARDLIRPA